MSSTQPLSTRAARLLSILGHPLLLLPLAIGLVLFARAGTWRALLPIALAFGVAGLLVMGYARWQVRRQRWRHVDASLGHERRALNRVLLVVLGGGAAMAWRAGAADVALGLALSAAMIALALLLARWCTLSLHVAFAVFAASLLWAAGALAGVLGLGFAALVAWSRLRLARHAPRDLVAGAMAGACAGAAFWQLMATQGT